MVNQTVKFYIVSVKAIMFEVNKTMIALILLVLLVKAKVVGAVCYVCM